MLKIVKRLCVKHWGNLSLGYESNRIMDTDRVPEPGHDRPGGGSDLLVQEFHPVKARAIGAGGEPGAG